MSSNLDIRRSCRFLRCHFDITSRAFLRRIILDGQECLFFETGVLVSLAFPSHSTFPLGEASGTVEDWMMSLRHFSWAHFVLAAAMSGCGSTNVHNPSFPVSRNEAKLVRKEMTAAPKTLQRPVVILSGFLDPGIVASSIRTSLADVVEGRPVLAISFATQGNFDSARDTLIEQIEAELPSSNPRETIEVDVIGHSMGGLIARYASLPRSHGKRLRIARLFTLATPHCGARWGGGLLPINELAADMDEGSAFIEMMAMVDHPFPIIPYVMLGDQVVGQENAAPKGKNPWWVDRRWYDSPHFALTNDDRVLADIFRRLRSEEPFTNPPPTPLPKSRD